MIARVKGKEKEQAKEVAEKVVNAISNGSIWEIPNILDGMSNDWTIELIEDVIKNYKSDNELECFDKYGATCNFNPKYQDGSKYEQENFYFYDDGSGFAYEYDLTTNGELNDLTLMLDFKYEDSNIKTFFDDIHVL